MRSKDSLLKEKLRPGDCLLYSPTGIFGLIISLKTWHKIAHVEVYIGEGWAAASRDGKGVGIYPLRTSQLCCILRPKDKFDINSALLWYLTVRGQKYDWFGLLRFAWRSKVVPNSLDNRMFCSEFVTRFYRAGDFDPFSPETDADEIAPFQFLTSPEFDSIDSCL